MKTETKIVQMNTALRTLPSGATITSAKGRRTHGVHSMEITYAIGTSINTIIVGGNRA